MRYATLQDVTGKWGLTDANSIPDTSSCRHADLAELAGATLTIGGQETGTVIELVMSPAEEREFVGHLEAFDDGGLVAPYHDMETKEIRFY